jgi:hypothetical protein
VGNAMVDRQVIDAIRARLTNVPDVVRALGYLDGARPLGRGGLMIRCPWHQERTPSCAVTTRGEALFLYCHGACKRGGDLFEFIAAATGRSLPRDFHEVLVRAADLAGISLDPRTPLPPPRRPLLPAPPRTYPPSDEVERLWSQCAPVGDDPAAVAWCCSRGLDAFAVEDRDLARVLPVEVKLPVWARYRGDAPRRRTWVETGHRVLVPAVDDMGRMRSLRAIRIEGDADTPKRLPAAGHLAAGLVLADPLARLVFLGEGREGWPSPLRIIVCEGEPDFLTWATRYSDADENAPAVIGVLSGGWTAEHAARIPNLARIIIRTDQDKAGDGYAADVAASLAPRCDVLRSREAA